MKPFKQRSLVLNTHGKNSSRHDLVSNRLNKVRKNRKKSKMYLEQSVSLKQGPQIILNTSGRILNECFN